MNFRCGNYCHVHHIHCDESICANIWLYSAAYNETCITFACEHGIWQPIDVRLTRRTQVAHGSLRKWFMDRSIKNPLR